MCVFADVSFFSRVVMNALNRYGGQRSAKREILNERKEERKEERKKDSNSWKTLCWPDYPCPAEV